MVAAHIIGDGFEILRGIKIDVVGDDPKGRKALGKTIEAISPEPINRFAVYGLRCRDGKLSVYLTDSMVDYFPGLVGEIGGLWRRFYGRKAKAIEVVIGGTRNDCAAKFSPDHFPNSR